MYIFTCLYLLEMVRMTIEIWQRTVLLRKGGMKIADIHLHFKEERFTISLTSLCLDWKIVKDV